MADNDLVWFLFTPTCFAYFTKLDIEGFVNGGCLAFVISKLLGYGIIAGAALLKIPQIFRVASEQSGRGLSIMSLGIESIGFATTTAYFYKLNYPLSTYGEAPLIFIQNLILFLLIFHYENKFTLINILLFIFGILYFILGIFDIIPFIVIEFIFSSQFFITLGARVPQIIAIFQNKSTGALAFITTFLQFAGTLARLFTTYQEIDDIIPLLQFVLSAVLNGTLFALFFVYPSRVDITAKKTDGDHITNKKINDTPQSPTTPRRRKRKKAE